MMTRNILPHNLDFCSSDLALLVPSDVVRRRCKVEYPSQIGRWLPNVLVVEYNDRMSFDERVLYANRGKYATILSA